MKDLISMYKLKTMSNYLWWIIEARGMNMLSQSCKSNWRFLISYTYKLKMKYTNLLAFNKGGAQTCIEWLNRINCNALLGGKEDQGEDIWTSISKLKSNFYKTSNCQYQLNGVVKLFQKNQWILLPGGSTAAVKRSNGV